MKKLVLSAAVAALLVPATPAPSAIAATPTLRPCNTVGLAIARDIRKHGPSCQDSRVVLRSVESHAAQCRPYRQATIAPFRQCRVTPVLSTGLRKFTCRSRWIDQGDAKRWWRTTCRSAVGDVLVYRRDGNAP
jgi:hypothetical protein